MFSLRAMIYANRAVLPAPIVNPPKSLTGMRICTRKRDHPAPCAVRNSVLALTVRRARAACVVRSARRARARENAVSRRDHPLRFCSSIVQSCVLAIRRSVSSGTKNLSRQSSLPSWRWGAGAKRENRKMEITKEPNEPAQQRPNYDTCTQTFRCSALKRVLRRASGMKSQKSRCVLSLAALFVWLVLAQRLACEHFTRNYTSS